jgi:RNA polymerase sigma factor (sigma-70 family)
MTPKMENSSAIEARALGQDDAALIGRCRAGHSDAWDALVDRYQRLVFAIPRRAGLGEEEASDIFQEVFLTLFERLDDLEEPEKVRAWLVTTAKFKTWAAVRETRGSRTPATSEEMEREMAAIPDGSPLADARLVELENHHLVRTAMNRLGDPCRTLLRMIFVNDPPASYTDVAAEIGVGQTSIGPMRSRCLKKLEILLR